MIPRTPTDSRDNLADDEANADDEASADEVLAVDNVSEELRRVDNSIGQSVKYLQRMSCM